MDVPAGEATHPVSLRFRRVRQRTARVQPPSGTRSTGRFAFPQIYRCTSRRHVERETHVVMHGGLTSLTLQVTAAKKARPCCWVTQGANDDYPVRGCPQAVDGR